MGSGNRIVDALEGLTEEIKLLNTKIEELKAINQTIANK
tara:strand:+ start:664 stop:780 length:117 start_codon:yes stop_codon:yes gene_type:complete